MQKPLLRTLLTGLLSLLLQAAPILRTTAQLQAVAGPPTWAIILKLGTATVALLGGYHAVSGATTSIATPYTVNAKTGTSYARYLGTLGQSAHYWTAGSGPYTSTSYAIAPGLSLSETSGEITGIPTKAGTNTVTITAWEFLPTSGGPNVSAVFTVIVTNGITAPGITSPPAGQVIDAGGTASFSVTASGTAPLAYQWRFNAVNLAGATTNPLVLLSVQTAQAGAYTVVVTNAAGSVTSSAAGLVVRPPVSLQTSRQGNLLLLSFNASATTNYFLDSSPDLTNWSNYATFVASTNPSTVAVGPTNRDAFFRVRH